MILNDSVRLAAITAFRDQVPKKTGHLRYDANNLIPIVGYDAFGIRYEYAVAPYGAILESAETIKYYYGKGSRSLPLAERPYKELPNKHKGWFSEKGLNAALLAIAQSTGGMIIK